MRDEVVPAVRAALREGGGVDCVGEPGAAGGGTECRGGAMNGGVCPTSRN